MNLQNRLARSLARSSEVKPFVMRKPRPCEMTGLSQAIVNAIREPLLVLDSALRVLTASPSFCSTFHVGMREVQGQDVGALCKGQLNLPEMRRLLGNVLPRHRAMETYLVEMDVPRLGRRAMRLHAREMRDEWNGRRLILLSIEDVTELRAAEQESAALLSQKDILLRDMQHRVANSLQLIGSILLLEAGDGCSDETRLRLRDVHRRIMSVATVQRHLDPARHGGQVSLAPYLLRLCEVLRDSIVDDNGPIAIEVHADSGTVSSAEAVSFGLIVTELVINALKHAFGAETAEGLIAVAYEVEEAGWRLTVSDNGIRKPHGGPGMAIGGLGRRIVEALARQLDGRVESSARSKCCGTSVSITHGSLKLRQPHTAECGGG